MKIRILTIAIALTSIFASQYAFAKTPTTVAASKHNKKHKKHVKKAAETPTVDAVEAIA